ncbi:MAG TPA: NAD(P)-dependent alcohol dehydrogenase [Anaeromyxobacteraceae bacterium]
MRAVEYDRYGSPEVLQIREVPRPVAGPGQLLVRVRAAALNPKDVLVRSGKFSLLSGHRFPKRVGFDWAGEVAEVGPGVTDVAAGARWFGMLDGWRGGACAEYLAARADESAPMPASFEFERAAAVPLAASTALQALRDVARLEPRMRVLVNGGSGGVGTFAIQIARRLGAHVTATASGAGLELCRGLGADAVVDHRAADALASPEPFHVVFDVFGNWRFGDARRALAPGGTYVSTVPRREVLLAALLTRFASRRARLLAVRPRARDLALLAAWADAGHLAPVVREVFPLDRITEAEAAAGTKHTLGKIVVRVG